jgi:hypothetical protein
MRESPSGIRCLGGNRACKVGGTFSWRLDPQTDSLRVYHLCAACAGKVDLFERNPSLEAGPVRIL